MTAKEFVFEEEARQALSSGIDQLAEVVALTLGPKGRNVGLQASFGSPTITSDGSSIAKDFELKDPFLNMGVSMAKEVAAKIKETAGDGTSTGIVLLKALVQAGVKNIAAGANPIFLKRGMERAKELIVKAIESLSIPVVKPEDIQNIATVSASGNQEVGKYIAECFQKVGKAGIVTIEEGKGIETIMELVEGMQLDRGYVSAYFATNQEKLSVEMQNARVLITDKKISSAQELLPILQQMAASGQELLIIAEEIEGDALSTLVVNKLRGTLKVAAIKAPAFGDRRKAILEDLAVLTGASVIAEEKGLILKEADLSLLGFIEKIVITKDKTILVGGKGDPDAIRSRIAEIEGELSRTHTSYDKEKLQERKAKLQGGVAVLKVGAPTESEMKKKKQMYEDSLHSTRSALEKGIVPGGGVALWRASQSIGDLQLEKEEALGAKILLKACEAPLRQIIANTGHNPSVVLEKLQQLPSHFGFNAIEETIENFLEKGIIDSAKVVLTSLQHAVSMAGMVLLSEALIANEKEE